MGKRNTVKSLKKLKCCTSEYSLNAQKAVKEEQTNVCEAYQSHKVKSIVVNPTVALDVNTGASAVV